MDRTERLRAKIEIFLNETRAGARAFTHKQQMIKKQPPNGLWVPLGPTTVSFVFPIDIV